jgi:hypothetical protein
MAVAVGVVGCGVGLATRSGARHLDGDLDLFPAVLAAYIAHGLTHLAQSAVLRGYTPGVMTVPLVIAPYSAWAWRALYREGVRRDATRLRHDLAVGAPLALGLAVSGHAIGRLAEAAQRRFPAH